MQREAHLAGLAFYQQAVETAERANTLMREIDDISREVHQQLDESDV
jgi:hypothetical protein